MKKTMAKLIPAFYRNLLIFGVSVASVAFVFFLLFINYHFAVDLRETNLKNMISETEKGAGSIGFFFADRRGDLINLSLGREISAFFENKSLGMSMEYGLKYSLFSIRDCFQNLVNRNKLGSDAIYSRIMLIEKNGAVLVDTVPTADHEAMRGRVKELFVPKHRNGVILAGSDEEEIVVSLSYFFKDRHEGQIIAWINPQTFYKHILGAGSSSSDISHLVMNGAKAFRPVGFSLPPQISGLPDLAAVVPGKPFEFQNLNEENQSWIGLKMLISDTPFYLLRLIPATNVVGKLTPNYILMTMGVIAFILIGGAAFIVTFNIQTKETIRESEEKYRAFFETSRDCVFITSKDGRWIDFNDAAVRFFGYDHRDELKEVDISDLYQNAQDRHRHTQIIEQQGFCRDFPVDLRKKDGTVINTLITSVLKKDKNGKVIGYQGTFKDVTGQRQAEEGLRKSEENYRNIFENAVMGIFQTTPNGRYLRSNPAGIKMYGYESAEDMIKSVTDMSRQVYVDPQDRKKLKEILESKGCVEGFESEHYRKDKSKIWTVLNSRAVRDVAGRILYHETTVEDITKRKRAEKALRESEERFRSTFEQAAVGIAHVSTKGRFLRINRRFCEITGYSREEMLNLTYQDITHPDDVERDLRHIQQILEGLIETYSAEKRYIRKDGKLVWVNLTVAPLRKLTGEPRYFISVVKDITDRKQAEELYRTLADSSHAGVYIVQDGKFRFVSPYVLEYSGYSENELIGNDSFNIVHPEDRALLRENAIDMLKERRTNPYEYRIIDRKSNIKRIMETVRSITYGGKRAVLGNTMDVTERYHMESMLRQAQKMEAIGTLAGGIAHDFNNILTAILGYTDMALTNPKMDDRQRGYLEQIFKSGERARDLTKQILTFSRQQEQEKKPVLIAPIIKEGIKLLRSSLPTTVKITQNIKGESLMVLSDPTQIHQVVMNLCTNAAYAMQERGGILDIQMKQERVDLDRTLHPFKLGSGDYAKLIISDTGHGMDVATIDRIFDPFFTTKEPGKGTGLGLSVVYGIVRDHGGAIDLSSEPGKGTTVTIYFPLIEPEETIREEAYEPIPVGSERILFIDDEATLAELGSSMLKSLGYHVTSSTSSTEALEKFRANPYDFDLVITDMTMPNIRGDNLAKELLKIRPEIPIILCTGFSELISEEKAKSIGIRQFVMKPVKMKVLADTIREVLKES